MKNTDLLGRKTRRTNAQRSEMIYNMISNETKQIAQSAEKKEVK